MTTTSAGPHGFHVKPLVTIIAAAAIVAATVAVAQQVGRDTPQSAPAAIEATTEVASPAVNPYRLSDALADGKLDAGLIPAPKEPAIGSVPEAALVPIAGQGGLYDALTDGKFGLDFGSNNPGVQFVRSPEAVSDAGGLHAAFDAGKFDAGLADTEPISLPSPAATYTLTVSGGHQQ